MSSTTTNTPQLAAIKPTSLAISILSSSKNKNINNSSNSNNNDEPKLTESLGNTSELAGTTRNSSSNLNQTRAPHPQKHLTTCSI